MADEEHENACELRERLEKQRKRQQDLDEQIVEARRSVDEAEERQRLRRELDANDDLIASKQNMLDYKHDRRRRIDSDISGPHLPEMSSSSARKARAPVNPKDAQVMQRIHYGRSVVRHEQLFKIEGLSWLPSCLEQEERECTTCEPFRVVQDDETSTYILVFSPITGSLQHKRYEDVHTDFEMIDEDTTGTLALVRTESHYGTNLDTQFFVQAASGEFKQWGKRSRVAVPAIPWAEGLRCWVGGPDLAAKSKGVFGLPFAELLTSEWVQGDTITFKCVIEELPMAAHPEDEQIRIAQALTENVERPKLVEVPPPTITDDLLAMLIGGWQSDITIEVVHGEEAEPVRFTAHASLLSQRSAVFAAALAHGMRESQTRTITVSDVPPIVLKALLYFLYTDDFEQVDKALREGGLAEVADHRHAQLQALLAAAHKYQVLRLLRWVEAQLCSGLSIEVASSFLALAHTYEAAQLETHCLNFIKAHMAQVCARADFGSLSHACLVKLNMHCAGVDPATGTCNKRKRGVE